MKPTDSIVSPQGSLQESKTAPLSATATATLAAGCFWGVEHFFSRLPGVLRATSGYTGGVTEEPGYREVCSGATGHAEAVEVVFDPTQISYSRLLDLFWQLHDPTTLNRQGPDIGTQYRSAIFFHTPEQEAAARASMAAAQAHFQRPIVTEITPATRFWPAEEYHQRYLEKSGRGACGLG